MSDVILTYAQFNWMLEALEHTNQWEHRPGWAAIRSQELDMALVEDFNADTVQIIEHPDWKVDGRPVS